MMSSMKKYFTYGVELLCGLPSVTLLGQKRDWEEILKRAERLKTFGDESTVWYTLLQPVLQRFVDTFDDANGEEIRGFWQSIAHYSGGGSGPTYLSGWITPSASGTAKANASTSQDGTRTVILPQPLR